MVRLLCRLDLLILGEIEKLSHAIQRLTGFDCFHQRNSMYAAMAGLYACYCGQLVLAPSPLPLPLRLAMSLLFGVGVWLWVERSIHGSPYDALLRAGVCKNPRGVEGGECARLRLTAIAISLVWLGSDCLRIPGLRGFPVAAAVPFTVSLYLDSCNPLPPCKGKIREWLRALRTPAPVPLGAPQRSSQELPGAANQAVLEAMWPK